MTKEEEDQLIISNMKLVTYCLNKFHLIPKGGEFDDYFQVGCIGLIKAARNYNPDLGYEFSTYAMSAISGVVRAYRRDYGTHHDMFRIPRATRDKINQSLEDAIRVDDESEDCSAIFSKDYNKLLIELDRDIKDSDGNTRTMGMFIEDIRSSIQYLSDMEVLEIIENSIMRTIRRIRTTKIWKNSIYTDNYVDMFEEYIYSKIYGEEELSTIYLAKKYGFSQACASRCLREFMGMMKKSYEIEMNKAR